MLVPPDFCVARKLNLCFQGKHCKNSRNFVPLRPMKDIPMVSVVMVAYWQQELIERAIRGVVRQKTSFPIELIVVDDCSPDETFERACEWQRCYPGIVKAFRNSTNIGLQQNYMRALRHCSGKYLAMCDADDYWCDHSKLRRQVEYMEEHPECAITFHRVVNHFAGTGIKSLSNGGQRADTTIADLSRSNYITNCSVMYRRELVGIDELEKWFSHDIWPDYPTHMLYARHGVIHYFTRPMAVYRQGGKGAWTASGAKNKLQKAIKVRNLLLEEFQDNQDAQKGLQSAIDNIEKAMQAIDSGILPTSRKPALRRLLTICRKIFSLLIPLPRP